MLLSARLIFRSLWRDKPFTLGVIATLAFVIGGNASVFTVVRSVLLRPLPMTRPEGLVAVAIVRRENPDYPFNLWAFSNFRQRTQTLEEMAAIASFNANVSDESEPERIPGVRVTANYFSMTGLKAAAGRLLLPEDDIPGRNKVVVLTFGFWQRRYGGDPKIIGATIRLNNEPYRVVGVLPSEFAFGYNTAELAAPLSPESDPARDRPTAIASLRVNARLRSGASVKSAQDDLNAVVAHMKEQYPEAGAWLRASVRPLSDQMTSNVRPLLMLLMAAVVVVLLIACANIAGLTLARASSRRHEFSVRIAIGAGLARLLRQSIAESALLAGTGGALGIWLARISLPALLRLSPSNLPRANEIHVDLQVLAAVAAVACGIAVLLGTLAAVYAAHINVGDGLRSQTRSGTGEKAQNRARNVFVVAEVALAFVLLVAAGLVIRSFVQLRSISLGFEPGHLLTARLSLPASRYKTAADVTRFQQQLSPAIASIPGVISNGAISILPLSGPLATVDYDIAGRPLHGDADRPTADFRMIDDGYLSALGERVVEGRNFNASDSENSRAVALVNQALARQDWPKGGAVGSRLITRDAGAPREIEIVGVVADIRATSITTGGQPTIFIHIPQVPAAPVRFLTNSMFWVVRTTTPPETLAKALGDAIHRIDPTVAASSRFAMGYYLDRAIAEQRFTLRLLLVFSLSALALAAQGVYALVSHVLARQTREIGIRLALGAAPAQVARMIAKRGVSMALPGLLCGVGACAAFSKLLKSLLFKVTPWDPLTIGVVVALLAFTVLSACLRPVLRTMRVDPVTALRD
jgi:putative ABC transport system permease protein